MKNILITINNGYIGSALGHCFMLKEKYNVHLGDLREESWRDIELSKFDVIVHTAAITPFQRSISEQLYQKVNTQLTIELAEKAKLAGVSQFIFMSTMSVYSGSQLKNDIISVDTVPVPQEMYGKSKLQAEIGLNDLSDEKFKIVIIRSPMVYGKGVSGNYSKLSYLARSLPIFPKVYNQRSMLHIDNLCELIRQIIEREMCGLFFPQNGEYVCTSDLVEEIAKLHERRMILISLFNPFIKLFSNVGYIKKLFGNLTYDKSLSIYDFDYQIRDFKKSIELTEK